jgi:RNA polymerase sigma-70 factor (ECF subfamily)
VQATSTRSTAEKRPLESVRSGEDGDFSRLVEAHRRDLHAHCYRMLGSVDDAEDALQETLLRAWRGLPGFDRRRPLRPWLYKIATNVCLDAIARRRKRVLPFGLGGPTGAGDEPLPPLAGSVWVEPYPDEQLALAHGYASPEARFEQREAVELAFIAALQHLPARQRAVLILRDVLGFSALEVAETLETTPASVNSALQRARGAVDQRLPDRSQQATLRSLGEERVRQLVADFVDAWDRADIDAIVALLAEDVMFSMPPSRSWYRGEGAIEAFVPAGPPGRWRIVPTRANGQLAFGAYRWDSGFGTHRAAVLDVLALRDHRIAQITAFATPTAFARFDLADELRR